jgi:hypothetical protein
MLKKISLMVRKSLESVTEDIISDSFGMVCPLFLNDAELLDAAFVLKSAGV